TGTRYVLPRCGGVWRAAEVFFLDHALMDMRRGEPFPRPTNGDPGNYEARGSQCARTALAHEFRHRRAFCGFGDRFLDHSTASAGKHGSAADPAGSPPG